MDAITSQDITIMLCGPLHYLGLEAIPYYLSKSLHVVYSTWKPKNETQQAILEKVKDLLSEDNIVVSEDVDVSNVYNSQNIYYQACTWNQGGEIMSNIILY